MMRKLILIALIIALAAAPAIAEPVEIFRGLNWQSDLRSVLEACKGDDIAILDPADSDFIRIAVDDGGRIAQMIVEDDKLQSVCFNYDEIPDEVAEYILQSIAKEHGTPGRDIAQLSVVEESTLALMLGDVDLEEEDEADEHWWQKALGAATWAFSCNMEVRIWTIGQNRLCAVYWKPNTSLADGRMSLCCMPVM